MSNITVCIKHRRYKYKITGYIFQPYTDRADRTVNKTKRQEYETLLVHTFIFLIHIFHRNTLIHLHTAEFQGNMEPSLRKEYLESLQACVAELYTDLADAERDVL